MISVHEAEELILAHTKSPETKILEIENLRNEVLLESIVADRNSPPFHRVAMDGIAFRFEDWESGCRQFKISGVQKAGSPQLVLQESRCCLEVMTGSVLPQNANIVVRYEDVEIKEGFAHVRDDHQVSPFENIHQEGVDFKKGDVLLSEGQSMLSPQWAIAASIGHAQIKVARRSRVVVVSTGDELVDVRHSPEPHQIRRSNVYAILASLRALGFENFSHTHLPDQPQAMHENLEKVIKQNDVIILSGGVSAGKFDFVPQALADLNVREIFHKVRQKPGKPFWFGVAPDNKTVFGLPGNPVSALVCFHRYVAMSLRKSMGIHADQLKRRPYAILKNEIKFKKPMTQFLPARLSWESDGKTYATPISSNGSGDYSSLSSSDGFIELPAELDVFKAGEAYPLFVWDGGCL